MIMDDNIGKRITELLSTLGLKKTDMAKRLSLSDSSISTMCSGKNKPSRQTVMLICKEFSVNEKWLCAGVGEMFLPQTKAADIMSVFSSLAKMDDNSPNKRTVLWLATLLAQLTEKDWERIAEIAEAIKTTGLPDFHSDPEPSETAG